MQRDLAQGCGKRVSRKGSEGKGERSRASENAFLVGGKLSALFFEEVGLVLLDPPKVVRVRRGTRDGGGPVVVVGLFDRPVVFLGCPVNRWSPVVVKVLLVSSPTRTLPLAGDRPKHRRKVLFGSRPRGIVKLKCLSNRRLAGDLEARFKQGVC